MSTSSFLTYALDMSDAVKYYHERVQIVHRELQLEHWIMREDDGSFILRQAYAPHEFEYPAGSSEIFSQSIAAPEQTASQAYSLPSDVYQLGQLFALLLNTNFLPIKTLSDLNIHPKEYTHLISIMLA
jgi:hypothetical protein